MVDFTDVSAVGFSLLLFYILYTLFHARTVWKQFSAIPGRRTLISEFWTLVVFTKEIKYITPGAVKGWTDKHRAHNRYGWDVISSFGLLPTPQGGFLVADAHAAKMIFSSRLKFPKPSYHYKALKLLGGNIIAAEFDEWKRHRKVAAPAFSEKNNRLVFEETTKVITSLLEGDWRDKGEVAIDSVRDLMKTVALMALSAAAFGYPINWGDNEVPSGHKLSFKRSVETLGSGLAVRFLSPKWLFEWAPTKKIRDARDGFAEFRSYMVEMINERKLSDDRSKKRDLLSSFVNANEEFLSDGKQLLMEEELIGNGFMFYFAGYETTGHTLSFALNMLAVYPEEQQALYQHIKDVLPDGRLPRYEDIPRLKRVIATIYETLRMFPPLPSIPKLCAEDTAIVVGNQDGETATFPIPAGSSVTIDVAGIHYNPRYWEDPFAFKPERFLGNWNKDAFVPFSVGSRACIGRGFFETEGLAVLTILLQRYRVEPRRKFAGETFEQVKERYSQGIWSLTLQPLYDSLVFKKRE